MCESCYWSSQKDQNQGSDDKMQLVLLLRTSHSTFPTNPVENVIQRQVHLDEENLAITTAGRLLITRRSFKWRAVQEWKTLSPDLRGEQNYLKLKKNKKKLLQSRPPPPPHD